MTQPNPSDRITALRERLNDLSYLTEDGQRYARASGDDLAELAADAIAAIAAQSLDPMDGPATFGQQEAVRSLDRKLSRRVDAAGTPSEPTLGAERLARAMVAVMTHPDRPLDDGFEWYGTANDLAQNVAAEYARLQS